MFKKKTPLEEPPLAAPREPPLDAPQPWNDPAALSTADLVGERIPYWSSIQTSRMTKYYRDHIAWMENPAEHETLKFAYIPMWRYAENCQHLDEIMLLVDTQGVKRVRFNQKGEHGSWVYQAPFLDITLNVRYGEYDNQDPAGTGKVIRFQSFPGTTTWIRCEPGHDLCWTVVLAELLV